MSTRRVNYEEVFTMKKLEFDADVDSFKNDRKDETTITLKTDGRNVDLSQLREMKQTATVRVVIESNQTELLEGEGVEMKAEVK